MKLSSLLSRIRTEFPDLEFASARLANGDDNWMVILDETWAMRFPRSAEQAKWFPVECAVLSALNASSPGLTPRFERMAQDGLFAGYRMIAGEPLTPKAFANLPRSGLEQIIDQIGTMMRVLHALPDDLATLTTGERRTTAGREARVAKDYHRKHRQTLARSVDSRLLARLDRLFAVYPGLPWQMSAVIHGDLSEDHILFASDGITLAGVIDFGDVVIGDPAYDLALFWSAGDWAAARAVEAYGGDAAMLERSRWSYARHTVLRLCWALDGDVRYSVEGCRQDLQHHLGALGL